jgi:hypothetical protein
VTVPPTFEPAAIVAALARHGVRYVLIGGYAAELQGVQWLTYDLDVVIDSADENYLALAGALVDIDAWCLVPPGSVQRIRPDIERIRSLTGTMMLRTRHGRLDVLKSSDSGSSGAGSSGADYGALMAEALQMSCPIRSCRPGWSLGRLRTRRSLRWIESW